MRQSSSDNVEISSETLAETHEIPRLDSFTLHLINLIAVQEKQPEPPSRIVKIKLIPVLGIGWNPSVFQQLWF